MPFFFVVVRDVLKAQMAANMDGGKLDDEHCVEPDVDVSQYMLDDLQLAAELGKTLLARNRELEIMLKEHKTKNDEQQREIVHLRKQINAMAEVNDSRLKVYEQLEVGIQDLERSNHRLTLEKSRDKKQIKSLGANIESLEARCEEITQQLEETRQLLSQERRKNEKPASLHHHHQQQQIVDQASLLKPWTGVHDQHRRDEADLSATTTPIIETCAFLAKANSTGISDTSQHANDGSISLSDVSSPKELIEAAAAAAAASASGEKSEDNEELFGLITDMESMRRDFMAEKQRCCELEEQLVAIIQENQTLQGRIAISSTNEEMMSMHDEFSLLDDVRQGQMCSRCLRAMEEQDQASNIDGQSSVAPTEEAAEDDDRSLLGSEFSAQLASETPAKLDARDLLDRSNPYRDLVEKYEALLEVQRTSNVRKNNDVQLEKELPACGDTQQENAQSNNKTTMLTTTTSTQRGRASTEFSEAETSSSGFCEETCHKYTQTEPRPGYLLCSISNGEECKLSIYDDVSPIDTHFQTRPEYRELFKEIFGVLKKAADNKEDGDKSKISDEDAAGGDTVPQINEEFLVDFGDDTQSIISSVMSDQSFAMSECVTKLERKTAKKHINECKNQENRLPQATSSSSVPQVTGKSGAAGIHPTIEENGRVLTPVKREPLEFLTVAVGVKKKNRRKNRSLHNNGLRESPLASQPSPLAQPSPSHHARRTRKDFIPIPPEMLANPMSSERVGVRSRPDRHNAAGTEWNGSPMIIYNRNLSSASRPKQQQQRNGRVIELNGEEYHLNSVSQEFHKLKRLDLSYAEVLRRSDACEHQSQPMRVQRTQQSRWKSQNNRR